ncbi:MAG: hypothetical protein V1889_00990 [archaeon]
MRNVEFVGQLVDSMWDAVVEMERAIEKKRVDEANRLRTFIFDLHCQIANMTGKRDVRKT